MNNNTCKIENKIKQDNEIFKSASAGEKRVIIAKDALHQIVAGRFLVKRGNFFSVKHIKYRRGIWGTLKLENPHESFQQAFLNEPKIKCQGCALGAIFASTTIINNNSTIEETIDQGSSIGEMVYYEEKFSNGLNRFFTRRQLKLIEICFENDHGYFKSYACGDINEKESDKAILFIKNNRRKTATERLIIILNNIIANKGTFKP